MIKINRIFILSLLFFSTSGFAKEVLLFTTSGKPVSEYEETVHSLKKSDIIIFSNGEQMKIKNVLGEGGMARVFETSSGEAIRILKSPLYSDDYVESIRVLSAHGVPTPGIIRKYKAEFTLMEKLNIQFTMADLLVSGQGLSMTKSRTLFAALQVFAGRSARYLYVGDFRPDQVAFDGTRWILLDATDNHMMMDIKQDINDKTLRGHNIFMQFDQNYIDLVFGKGKMQMLEATIVSRRLLLTKNKCAFVHL